jgi:hypothetical protein
MGAGSRITRSIPHGIFADLASVPFSFCLPNLGPVHSTFGPRPLNLSASVRYTHVWELAPIIRRAARACPCPRVQLVRTHCVLIVAGQANWVRRTLPPRPVIFLEFKSQTNPVPITLAKDYHNILQRMNLITNSPNNNLTK